VADPEQHPADRLPGQLGTLHPGLVLGQRGRQLAARHHVRQRRVLGELEEDEQRAVDEHGQQDVRQRQPAGQQRRHDGGQRDRPSGVGDQHHLLAVPPVDQRARGQVADQERQRLREADQPGDRRRTGARQHQQRVRQRRDPDADRGHHLPGPQQHEVAVAPQRDRPLDHPRDASRSPDRRR
jgi:hypothetical protein